MIICNKAVRETKIVGKVIFKAKKMLSRATFIVKMAIATEKLVTSGTMARYFSPNKTMTIIFGKNPSTVTDPAIISPIKASPETAIFLKFSLAAWASDTIGKITVVTGEAAKKIIFPRVERAE